MLRIACLVFVLCVALTPTEAKAGPLCDLFHKLIPFKGGMCGSSAQSSGGCGLFRGGFSGICGSSAQPQSYGYSQGYSQPQYQPQIVSQFQPQQYTTVVAPPVLSTASYLCPCGTSCPCGGEARVGEAKVLPSYSAVVVGVNTPRFTLSAGGCVGGNCITPTQATRVEYSPKVTLK